MQADIQMRPQFIECARMKIDSSQKNAEIAEPAYT